VKYGTYGIFPFRTAPLVGNKLLVTVFPECLPSALQSLAHLAAGVFQRHNSHACDVDFSILSLGLKSQSESHVILKEIAGIGV
jgi:hypothetical protein